MDYERTLYWHNRPAMVLLADLLRGIDCVYLPKIGYLVNDARLASEILLHENFRSSTHGAMGGLISPIVGNYGLFNMDGEAHGNLKRPLMKMLSRSYVDSIIQATIPPLLDELRYDLCAGKTVNFVAFSKRLTTRIMLYLLGIDMQNAHLQKMGAAINAAVAAFSDILELNKTSLTTKELANVQKHIATVNGMIDTYGTTAPDALLYRLQDLGLSEKEARGLMLVIIAAGTETTNVTLPRVLALLLDTRQFALLKAQPDLLPHAVEEGIRITSASPVIIRKVESTTALQNHEFKVGRRTLLFVYNMMKPFGWRDFNIQREIPAHLKHLSFGRGAHFCLGFPIAIREMELTLSALLDLPATPQIIERGYPRGETFPGYTNLFLRLET
jgi:cytochrome P450